jgi:hypothetical protein
MTQLYLNFEMLSLRHFIADSRKNAQASSLRIVIGNTSCDMDSCVGAICLAYFYSVKEKTHWTPIINCKREEFYLRVEITKHLL